MLRFNQRSRANITTVATPRSKKFTRKKSALWAYPSQSVARMPLSLFPMDVLKNQPPIIKAVNRFGLTLLTSDNPIGLKNNSPTVMTP